MSTSANKKPLNIVVLFAVIVVGFFVSIFVRVGLRNSLVPLLGIEGNFKAYLSQPQHIWITLFYVAAYVLILIGLVFSLKLKFSFAPVRWCFRENKKQNFIVVGVLLFLFTVLYAVIFYSKGARLTATGFYAWPTFLPLLLILFAQAFFDTYLHHRFFLSGILQKLKPEDALGISAFLFGFYSLLLQDLVPLGFLNYFAYGALAAFLFWATENIALLLVLRFVYLLAVSFSTLHLPGYIVRGFIFIPDTSGFIGGGYYGAEGSLLLTIFLSVSIFPVYWFLIRGKAATESVKNNK